MDTHVINCSGEFFENLPFPPMHFPSHLPLPVYQETRKNIVITMEVCDYDLDQLIKDSPLAEEGVITFLHQLGEVLKTGKGSPQTKGHYKQRGKSLKGIKRREIINKPVKGHHKQAGKGSPV